MTRIIAGDWKGRALEVPTSVTRPTSSRVREAVFSSVTHLVGSYEEMNVLDIFAGSGAFAFEALSRGAKCATCIESDGAACASIRNNSESLAVKSFTVVHGDAMTILAGPASQQFDLVFIDPPYAVSDEDVATLLTQLAKNLWLTDGALVVVERAKKSTLHWPNGFESLNNKTYGDTSIWYGQYTPERVETSKE